MGNWNQLVPSVTVGVTRIENWHSNVATIYLKYTSQLNLSEYSASFVLLQKMVFYLEGPSVSFLP